MHVSIIFLLSVPFVLFVIKKLVAINVWRTRFSGLQYSVAKQEGRSLVMFSAMMFLGGSFARPI